MSGDTDNLKTIRVPREAYEAAKERKEDKGKTWGEYIKPDVSYGDEDDDEDDRIDELMKMVEELRKNQIDDYGEFTESMAEAISEELTKRM